MRGALIKWSPALLMLVGVVVLQSIRLLPSAALREPLDQSLPSELLGWQGRDIAMPDGQRIYAGVASYVHRAYSGEAGKWASVYIGYYSRQANGTTIHSPKNCLPGGGWEELESGTTLIQTLNGPTSVNRYLVRKGNQQALVLYWYQGRGRIQANEYSVKWNLLRDAVTRRRSEEALVRVVVPVNGLSGQIEALETAKGIASLVVARVTAALPV